MSSHPITRHETERACQCILNRHLGRLRCDHNFVKHVTWTVEGSNQRVFYRLRDAKDEQVRLDALDNAAKEA